MAVFRIHANDQYTAMSRHHLRDSSLSWQAMGMLSFMLSCSDTFKFSIEGLTKCSGCGESATRSALSELRDKGYVVISRSTDEKGKVAEWVYDIYEKPDDAKPVVGNPHVEIPDVEKQVQSKYNIRSTKIRDNSLSLFEENYSQDDNISTKEDKVFEVFWDKYGKKTQRVQAERMWKRLTKADIDSIMKSVDAYVASTPDVQFRMNPATYINPANRRWEDELRSQPNAAPQEGKFIMKDGVRCPVV